MTIFYGAADHCDDFRRLTLSGAITAEPGYPPTVTALRRARNATRRAIGAVGVVVTIGLVWAILVVVP